MVFDKASRALEIKNAVGEFPISINGKCGLQRKSAGKAQVYKKRGEGELTLFFAFRT